MTIWIDLCEESSENYRLCLLLNTSSLITEKNKTGRDGSGQSEIKIPSDLGEADHEPVQPKIASFNPKQYGNSKRDFSASWYNGHTWLEYSVEKGPAFCFPFRHFKISSEDCTFTKEGYSNWRHALDKHKGFQKHENSQTHVEAMVIWQERKMRIENDQNVSTMVNEKQLEKYSYYIKSVVEVIQFLCVNEPPMRGDVGVEQGVSIQVVSLKVSHLVYL